MRADSGPSDERDTLDRMYEAVFDDNAFARLAAVLAQGMASANGVLVIRENGNPTQLSATISTEAQRAYVEYYGRIDIWTQATARVAPLVASAAEDFISDDEVRNSEFYVDYAQGLDMYRPMGTTAPLAPGLTMMIGVNRPRQAQRYTDRERADLCEFARHLQRGLQLRRRFDNARQRAAIGFAALQQLSFGVVILGSDGKVWFANAAAEELHRGRAGIVLRAGRISTEFIQDAPSLAALIQNAAKGGYGGAIRIRGTDGFPSLLALVSRLPLQFHDSMEPHGLALVAFQRAGERAVRGGSYTRPVWTKLRGSTDHTRADERGATRGDRSSAQRPNDHHQDST